MLNRFGLLLTDIIPIYMIISMNIIITMRFSINCPTVICLLAVGVHYMPNSILHDCVYSPMFGWLNDEKYTNMCITYRCKLSCNASCWYICCHNYLNFHLTRFSHYSVIKTSIVQQWRDTKTDDLYIYHIYTLSPWLVYF